MHTIMARLAKQRSQLPIGSLTSMLPKA